MSLSRRTKLALLLAGVVLILAAPVLAETFLSSHFPGSGQVHYNTTNGLEVVVDGSYQLQSGNPFTNQSMNVSTETSGYINVSASGRGNITIDRINGTWTNASAITATTAIRLAPDDKQQLEVDGGIDSVQFQSVTVDDGSLDLEYSASSTATINVSGLTASTTYGAIDVNTGDVFDTDTADGSGEASFTDLDSGSHSVAIETGSVPTVDNNSATPTGAINTDSPTLEIDINDSDFQVGDNVSVEFYIDGSKKGTEHTTSNGTVSHDVSGLLGGDHTWHVELTDSYGFTSQSDTFNISTPSTIAIRDVEENHSLINDSYAEVLVAGSQETVRVRNITDGILSLAGLPLDEDYIIQVDAPDYYHRSVFVGDISQGKSIFMLNTSEASVENSLEVQDNTGQFEQANLQLQRAINRSLYDSNKSTEYQWTNVAGDFLGADSRYIIDLEEDARYRILIRNREGDVRELGQYTAAVGGLVTLTVGEIRWNNSQNATARAVAFEQGEGANTEIVVRYRDLSNDTSQFCYTVHEFRNASNELAPQSCIQDPRTYSANIQLTAQQANMSWALNWSAKRDGKKLNGTIPIGGLRELSNPTPEQWLTPIMFVALIGLLSAAPKASARTGGIVVVGMAFGITWWGWLAIPGPALGIAGALALIGKAADFNSGI